MKPEEMIRDLPGPPVEDWIGRLPAGSYSDRKAFLVEQGLATNHAAAVLWWAKNGAAIEAGGTYVSFGRPRQFAFVQPSTRTRVDVGLRLPGAAPTERLAEAGSFGSGNITHRVALGAPEDVDAELEGWLRDAYDARG